MPTLNHIHCYIRFRRRPGYYRCYDPICTHFLDKESLLGKMTACFDCGTKFILTREDLRRAVPRCLNCSNTKEAKAHRLAQELLIDLKQKENPDDIQDGT